MNEFFILFRQDGMKLLRIFAVAKLLKDVRLRQTEVPLFGRL